MQLCGWPTPQMLSFSGAIDYSAPAIMVRPDNEADIAFQGPGNSLRLYFAAPGSPWSASAVAAAGTTYSAPSIADRGGGEVDFSFTGIQNSLWYYNQTGYGPVELSQVSGYNTAYG